MARLLALDWDRLEARMIVARVQGENILIDNVATVPLELDPQESSLAGLESQLTQALAQQRFPRCQALTAIGRSLVELRVLKLPPAPADELPELVRFQAAREFSSLKDESPLDFVPLGDAGAESGEVMAAAISTDLARQLRGALTGAGHELSRAILRPCAATSLAMRRCEQARRGVTLVIAQSADSAEVAIAKDGMVVFTRSFRLPRDWHPGKTGEPLVGEVRRTIAAAQNQLGGSRVEHIVFFGTTSEHGVLCERLKERTELDVELLDPFAGTGFTGTAPPQPERFAALLGMLHDEAAGVRPSIDFVNPRRKPEPESKKRLYTLLVATAATIVLAISAAVYWQFYQLNREIATLQATHREIVDENKKLKPIRDLAQELDEWKEADRNWLDEFRRLSVSSSLTAEDFRIETVQATSQEKRPGTITISGRAKDARVKSILQDELADDTHVVLVGRSSLASDDPRYPRVFTTTIRTSESIPISQPEVKKTATSSVTDDNNATMEEKQQGQAED